ncbi:MAG: LamG domain-containing protein [Patescibacteria group bacterium]
MYKNFSVLIFNKFVLAPVTVVALGLLSWVIIPDNVLAASTKSSLTFDGTERSYVAISDEAQTGLDITGDMTIALWVKQNNLAGHQILVSKWSDIDRTSFLFYLEDGDVGIGLNAQNGGYGYGIHRLPHGKNAQEWFHVAMVYTAANGTAELFVNGNSIGKSLENVMPTSIADTDTDFVIGGRDSRTNFYDGALDEVKIWSRSLQANEIQSLFTNPKAVKSGVGLEGYWNFDGTYEDSSKNGNDLGVSFSSDTPF